MAMDSKNLRCMYCGEPTMLEYSIIFLPTTKSWTCAHCSFNLLYMEAQRECLLYYMWSDITFLHLSNKLFRYCKECQSSSWTKILLIYNYVTVILVVLCQYTEAGNSLKGNKSGIILGISEITETDSSYHSGPSKPTSKYEVSLVKTVVHGRYTCVGSC